MRFLLISVVAFLGAVGNNVLNADELPYEPVEGQPLAANVGRLVEALEFLGRPLPKSLTEKLAVARKARDAKEIQKLLDPHVVAAVSLNPEVRVKVDQGPGDVTIQQAGFTPMLVKVVNHSTVSSPLRVRSPQAGPVYSGPAEGILQRQAQTELNDGEQPGREAGRFLAVEMFQRPPMTRQRTSAPGDCATNSCRSARRWEAA